MAEDAKRIKRRPREDVHKAHYHQTMLIKKANGADQHPTDVDKRTEEAEAEHQASLQEE